MRLVLWLCYLVMAWKWGDWRNWRRYEGTMYYTIVFSLIYTLLCLDYPMWRFEADPSLPFLSNHVLISIAFAFIVFPSIILVYLGRFPKGRWQKIGWVLLWIAAMSLVELGMVSQGRQTFHNGWTMWTSVLFNCVMYPAIRLYLCRPLLTLLLSVAMTILYCVLFDVPVGQLP